MIEGAALSVDALVALGRSLPSNARTPKGVRDGHLETTTCATYCLMLDGRVQTWRRASAGSHVGVDAGPALAGARRFQQGGSREVREVREDSSHNYEPIFQKRKKQKNMRARICTDL